MAFFDALGPEGLDTSGIGGRLAGAEAPTFNPAAAPQPGKIAQMFSDPNWINALAQAGSGLSQGQPVGQALGGAAEQLATNRALQGATAAGIERQESYMKQLIAALQGATSGKRGIIGDAEDMNTINSFTMDNNGLTIKAPNPFRTKAFGDVTDSSLETQTQPTTLGQPGGRRETEAFPFL